MEYSLETLQTLAKAKKAEAKSGWVRPTNTTFKAQQLESQGWKVWLTTLFPFAFEEEFSDDHCAYWDLRWSVLFRIREQKKYLAQGLPIPEQYLILDKELAVLLILGRGMAKSSTLEASAVMRGALLNGGYCLYASEAQDQANEHLGNCRILIDHPDSRLLEFYPGMAINENARIDGRKTQDRQDIFITICGWIGRAKGLNSSLRGLRIGNQRPDDIKLDDIDAVNDSIAVSLNKITQITSSIIPTQARHHATIDFGQNLIGETTALRQIHTGKADALAERTTIGVSNTFVRFEEGLDYETYFDEEDGRVKHKILPAAIPTWAGVNIAQAQKFLNDSGLSTFLAEYQNQFEHLRTEKVFHEYNEERHIITWSDFERVFGCWYIPEHWRAKVSADIGYSNESLSAWLFTAAAAKNAPHGLASRYFGYRSLTFCKDSIDDQAEKLWEEMFPDVSVGKRHFEATQSFADYPELFRLLNTKPKCAPLLKNYTFNPARNKFEIDDSVEDEDKALKYVHLAEKTFRSQIQMWEISHEKSGEQKTLAQKYGIPVHKTKHFEAASGVSEANHLLRGDYTEPHPFFDDEKVLDENGNWTGKYKLGSPYYFIIVDDDQKKAPKDDRGFKIFREQVAGQRWTQEKMTDSGLTRTIPLKYQSDHPDAFRIFASDYIIPNPTPLTLDEEFRELLPAHIRDLKPNEEGVIVMTKQMQQEAVVAHQTAEIKMIERHGLDIFDEDEIDEDDDGSWW